MVLFVSLFRFIRWYLKKPLLFKKGALKSKFESLSKNKTPYILITSPSALKALNSLVVNEPIETMMPSSLELKYLDGIIKDLSEKYGEMKDLIVIGAGGGRVMDSSKYISKCLGRKLWLIPSVLSTTSWLNFGIALRKDNKLVFPTEKRGDVIIIDPELISTAPKSLTLGGLADLLCGYSAIGDWYIARDFNGENINKKAIEYDRSFLELIRAKATFLAEKDGLDESAIEFVMNSFLDVLSVCGASFSGRLCESSEHYLYYALDEMSPKGFNHGRIIALTTLVSLYFQQRYSAISINDLRPIYDALGLKISLGDFNIDIDKFIEILQNMREYTERNGYNYTVWNSKLMEMGLKNNKALVEFLEGL